MLERYAGRGRRDGYRPPLHTHRYALAVFLDGILGDADLASAQAAFARGDNKTARELADRAKQRFPIGSPGWVRADDIVAFNKNHKQNPLRIGQ